MPDWVDLLQWPAMVVTVAAAWFTASQKKSRRRIGFWLFVTSNILWSIWGLYSAAWALIVLQIALFVMNVRGIEKNDPEPQAGG